MTRLAPALLVLALAVSGCGGGATSDADPTPTVTATAAPAPEALSGFSCASGEDGLWTAAGTIANSSDEAASFTVNLYIGPADGQERPAQEVRLENIQAGESTPIQFTGVAAAGDPATCHIRVMRDLL